MTATIKLMDLPVNVVEASDADVLGALDAETRARFGLTAEQFIAAVREGHEFDDPGADALELLAAAFIG